MTSQDLAPSAVLRRDMEIIADIAASRFPGLRSLLLGGSFARGEGTFLHRGGRWVPYKDYDLFAVVADRSARHCASAVAAVRGAAHGALDYPPYDEESPSPGQFHIGIAVVPETALGKLPHDLSNAELRLLGKVIWGSDVRDAIRAEPHLIPPVSGLRPVLNKLIGLVEQWGRWVDDRASAPDGDTALAVSYDRAKAVLDLAAAILLFRGTWTAGYAARNAVLREREAHGPLVRPIGLLASRAESALAFKLSPVAPDPAVSASVWRDARDDLLRDLDLLAAEVLSYPAGDRGVGAQGFARNARISWLRPFAEEATAHYGIPFGAALAPLLVVGYSILENARIGTLGSVHPLIRAWSAAWAWLEATRPGADRERLLAWARHLTGASGAGFEVLRDRIVGLFKATSTARRRKRTL